LLLGVIAYNLGNLLRRLVLLFAIQSWSLTSLQQRLFKTGGRLIRHARYFVLQAGRELLDIDSLSANPRAHRATRVAPDVTEKMGHGGSEADSWIDAGRPVSEVGRQGGADPGASGPGRAESREGPLSSIPHQRNGRLERARLAEQHPEQARMVHIDNPGLMKATIR
jgi:hypothetical protein